MKAFSIDIETCSRCNIRLGSHKYAQDPSTRILMLAISNGGTPVLWDSADPDGGESQMALTLLSCAIRTQAPLWAFNVGFERTLLAARLEADTGLGMLPSLDQWRCSAVVARAAAVPPSLGKAAAYLRCDTTKDTVGKALIRIFSDLTKQVVLRNPETGDTLRVDAPDLVRHAGWTLTLAGEHVTVSEAWRRFGDYCRTDVATEMEVRDKLSAFHLDGEELDGFRFDLRMNERGIPLNVRALHNASAALRDYRHSLTARMISLTSYAPTQTGRLLEWLKARGYPGKDLTTATRKEIGDDCAGMTPEAREALEIRGLLSFVAVKKIDKMIETATRDLHLHDQFLFYGAQRTGRWTSKGVQLQNVRKPTVADPDQVYRDIKAGLDAWELEFLHGSAVEAIASCVRNFVEPHPPGRMLDVDYSNIEGRVAAWLAGQEDKLDDYRSGADLYKKLASSVFGVEIEEVSKEQRFVGKVGELGLGFGAGVKTFHKTCATWGMPIDLKLAADTVQTYREVNDGIVSTWRRTQVAMLRAMNNPGDVVKVNGGLYSFVFHRGDPFDRLLLILPSGRPIVYPEPEVARVKAKYVNPINPKDTREWETDEVTFYGPIRGHAGWGRVKTSGPDAYQSAVQGTARDILLHGCLAAGKAGFEIFAVIHDQALAHAKRHLPDGGSAEFIKALCDHPSWLPEDFPLVAEGGICNYYSK